MTKDEMKNKISMALKDPILQMGFEVICSKLSRLEKENAELDCQMNRNKYCHSCVNAAERCFRNEIGCPCEKYKSCKDENAELKEKISVLLSCRNCPENKGGLLCEKEYEGRCLSQKVMFIKELKEEIAELEKENAELKAFRGGAK